MGVVYKVKEEVKHFILAQKKERPTLSCRKLCQLIEEKFQTKVSKSSINVVLKNSGMSMPVGRRRKREKRPALNLQITPPEVKIEPVPEKEAEPVAHPEPIPPEPPVVKREPLPTPSPVAEPGPLPKEEPPVEQPVAEKPAKEVPQAEPPIIQPSAPQEVAPKEELPSEQPKEEPLIERPIIEQPEPAKEMPPSEPSVTQVPAQQDVTQKEVPKFEQLKEASRLIFEGTTSGAILLKAADFLICGTDKINEIIARHVMVPPAELRARTEATLYSFHFDKPPFSNLGSGSNLWTLVNQEFTAQDIMSYLSGLQDVSELTSELLKEVPDLFREVRGITVDLANKKTFYLDGGFHTVWSSQYIPVNLSSTICNIKTYIKRYFQDNQPLVLFTAPGYEIPINEFFEFMQCMVSTLKNGITSMTLYGNKLDKIETIKIEQAKERNFILGLWPWQYMLHRKVVKLNDFKPYSFTPLNKQLFIAQIEIVLSQPNMDNSFKLSGYAIKFDLNAKVGLVILGNFPMDAIDPEKICSAYLSHWPNMEEAFRDFSRKIELFTYTAGNQLSSLSEIAASFKDITTDLPSFFNNYLKMLHSYAKQAFLPPGRENQDFSTIKSLFYDLSVTIKQQKDYYAAVFKPPAGYNSLEDLKYACNRLNEKAILASDGKRYWFSC